MATPEIQQNTANRNFTQTPPSLKNLFEENDTLQRVLLRYMPKDVFDQITPDLIKFGELSVTDIARDAELCDMYLPRLIPIRPWGQRVDEIVVHEAWNRLHAVSAKEGLISIGYERNYNEFSRLYQFAKIFMFSSISIFSCPLAMTDGAARLVEVYGDDDLRRAAFNRLTSRRPSEFSTSGQWMTERTGGSDVSGTSTVARSIDTSNPDNKQILSKFSDSSRIYGLSGYKFFTSATTSGIAFTLARTEDDGNLALGNKGLSCFFVDVKLDNPPKDFYHKSSNPNNPSAVHPSIRVHRLKDKLGTKAVPTAELELVNTPAYLVGKKSKGISIISEMFNITRIHNAISSISLLHRSLALAKDFSTKRRAFGNILHDYPLHVKTIANVQVEYEACIHVTFYAIYLLGLKECGKIDTKQSGILRILMPLIKLYTAKASIKGISECLECLGGVGYMEDSGMPRLLRDAQVLPIWEGTTNVLSLDVYRVLYRTPEVLQYMVDEINSRRDIVLQKTSSQNVRDAVSRVVDVANNAVALYSSIKKSTSKKQLELTARDFSYALITSFSASLLLEEIVLSPNTETAEDVAVMYTELYVTDVCPELPDLKHIERNNRIAFGSRL